MLTFDEFGNLTPYEAIESNLQTLEEVLVFNEHRRRLFEGLIDFINDLLALDLGPFHVWVNGSFTTQKPNPKDIDIVIFVPFQQHEYHQKSFSSLKTLFYGRIDAYFVPTFPELHPSFRLFKSDQVDWSFLFASDRNKKKKGFLEIKFTKHGKAND